MGIQDPRVDAYIAQAPDFAKPILTTLRETVHSACPSADETMKWSRPHFMYRGGILCAMSAFKQHCSFGFWNGPQVIDTANQPSEAMGQLGRITSVADLPSKKVLIGYIKAAMQLREEGSSSPARAKPKDRKPAEIVVPEDLASALRSNRKALATFEAFSPSHKREYIEWIVDAKREETRLRRIETAVSQMADEKSLHWKYQGRPSK